MKSPPELWAEVSDVAALAGHLGAFGEIRITRLEHESTVAWEGDRARGTVELEPSGWGTKVTLTARLEPDAVAEAAAEPKREPEPEEPGPEELGPEEPGPEVTPPEPVAEVEEQPAPAPEPVRRLGFFARLFARRRDPEADRVATAAVEVPAVEEPAPAPPAAAADAADAGTTPAPLSAGRAEEILVGVLDDLGAARHRPFSRG